MTLFAKFGSFFNFKILFAAIFCLGILFGNFLDLHLLISANNFGQTTILRQQKTTKEKLEPKIINKNSNYFSKNNPKIAALTGIGDSTPECGKKTIDIKSIITPGEFFPVIPCAYDKTTGQIQPLSPALIPDIMIRAFGMIASLTFYLFFGILVLSGVMFIWDGINGNSRKMAERNLYDTIWALVLIFGTYTILMTILALLNFNFAKTQVQFFNFGT